MYSLFLVMETNLKSKYLYLLGIATFCHLNRISIMKQEKVIKPEKEETPILTNDQMRYMCYFGIMAYLLFLTLYGCCSLYEASINLLNWQEKTRLFLAIGSGITTLISMIGNFLGYDLRNN